ncbi:hypothetical protein P691DRAFT_665854 [Macrolepiota fuliginosa MF-IS2]|uniref:Spindle pole body component n=1 Tax=Macrolepiota fuliginosa MF-IS2 TaxID=1400762 RepID=A0A9P6C314_9AGAR|nr:hypothetical protein P691DRAFT_665854 [Macrolepiota fuliginosa MF-IS2]
MSTTPTHSRPGSSLSRPSSSLSQRNSSSRPPSSASQRPQSSASTTRPRSSASSARPISASSGRPQSRFSQRTQSRLAKSRVNPFAQALVAQVTGLKEDDDPDAFKKNVDYVVKSLESTTLNKGAASVDLGVVEKQIAGHALKARVMMKDSISEALLTAFKKLKAQVEARERDLDHDIQTTRVPDHLQFLINLSQPPSASTASYAEHFLDEIKNPRLLPDVLTWKDILAEEPFEGEHWEGIFDNKPRDEQGWDSTPSLSPLSSDLEDGDSMSSLSYEGHRRSRSIGHGSDENRGEDEGTERSGLGSNVPPHTYAHRQEFEELQSMQYWRTDWKGYVRPSKQFDIGDPSTLGPALADVLARKQGGLVATQALLQHERYIREEDMVREIYMALEGRRNIILEWKDNAYTTTPETPRLAHLTLASQETILSSLAETATTLEHLRHFRSSVFTLSYSRSHTANPKGSTTPPRNMTRTVEAFADAVDTEIRAFDIWCADQEAAICGVYATSAAATHNQDIITSLLHTSKSISDTFEHTFPVLLRIINDVFSSSLSSSSEFCISYVTTGARAPAMVSSRLLDVLFASVQVHLEREEVVTSGRLMRVFVRSAEPVWGMCGRWLRDGMGLGLPGLGANTNGRVHTGKAAELDEEFFIEAKVVVGFGGEAHVGLLHPEFWQEAYGLREGVDFEPNEVSDVSQKQQKAVPMFLEHVAEMILRTGKAVGLIRALGSNVDVFRDGDWKSFGDLVVQQTRPGDVTARNPGHLFSVSVDTLSRLIYERLLPRYQEVGSLLTKILVDECGLWKHSESIEGLFLMRRGDAMSHFIDVIFNKMDSKQSWSDFHFLNTAFTDVVEANVHAGARDWIQPSLVRFSYRGGKDKERTIYRTVRAIDGLTVEYAVPFPLTYIFRPSVVATYSEVFGFLLQIRRAKSVLEKILVRGDDRKNVGEGMKVFYAMRSRLSWFINTLLNFLTTYVIHAQVVNFHKKLSEAQLFDDMIELHDEHLNKIQGRCLLKKNTSALHRAILSILDMALQFSEFFVTFTGDAATTHDISRHSHIKRHHRSRRQRRKRRNVIGFSQPSTDEEMSSSDDDDGGVDIDKEPAMETETFSTMNVTGSPEEIAEKLDEFSSELDGLVRFIRTGMESLAGGTSEAAPTFGVLAFALEDWDA